MKIIFISAFIILTSLTSFAQKNMEDVIYLKNGSRIQGTILQLFPDSIVQVRQAGGTVWVFSMKEVSMIDKEEKVKSKPLIEEAKGYQFGIDAGVLIGSGNSSKSAPLGVHMLNSYRIIPTLAAGLGAGLEFFETTQLPVYMDMRYYLNKRFYAPYIFLQGGVMLPLGKEITYAEGWSYKGKPGMMINPGIGFLFPLNEKSAFSVSFSYRYHELKYERTKVELTEYTRFEQMNRFNLRFGFILR